MSKNYNTKTIAEIKVSEEVIKALLESKDYLEQKSFIYIQDEINNESTLQITLVVSDWEDSNNDNLIIRLSDKCGSSFLVEIVELVSACCQARDDGFDNFTIYI